MTRVAVTISPTDVRRRTVAGGLRRALVRGAFIVITLGFLTLFLFLPLIAVLVEAFREGFGRYFGALRDPDAVHAMRLTLTAAAIAVPLNLVFGVAAAWTVAKFDFRGKQILVALIDLPFAV